jgi:uncharacterized protein
MDRTAQSAETRTCVGCLQKDNRDALLRLVAIGDPPQLVPDIRRRATGRGVSVHPRRSCVEKALQKKGIQRAFRREIISPSINDLVKWAADQYHRRMEGLIMAAGRNRRIALGTDAVGRAIDERSIQLLVVATDALGSHQEASEKAAGLGIKTVIFGTKESNGRLFGRELVGVLAILDKGIAEQLASAADRCETLAEDS